MFFKNPNILLRVEGLAISILGIISYWKMEYSWAVFWSTILIPDLAILAYLINKEIGAVDYNVMHAKILPSAVSGLCCCICHSVIVGIVHHLVRAYRHRPIFGLWIEIFKRF